MIKSGFVWYMWYETVKWLTSAEVQQQLTHKGTNIWQREISHGIDIYKSLSCACMWKSTLLCFKLYFTIPLECFQVLLTILWMKLCWKVQICWCIYYVRVGWGFKIERGEKTLRINRRCKCTLWFVDNARFEYMPYPICM